MANIYYDKNIDIGTTDDEEIEALIRQELDALEDNVIELEEDLGLDQPDENIDENEKLEIEAYEKSISQYLDLIKYNQDKASQTILASQETLIEKSHDSQPSMDTIFAEKLKKLLEEDEQESDSQTENLIQLREKALKELEKNDFVGGQSENKLIVAVYNPELVESIAKLEEEENEKLQTLLKKQEEEEKLEAERSKETMEELLVKEKVLDNKIEQRMKDFEKNLETFQETERVLSTVDSSKVSFLKEMEDEFQAPFGARGIDPAATKGGVTLSGVAESAVPWESYGHLPKTSSTLVVLLSKYRCLLSWLTSQRKDIEKRSI
eukprot:gene11554-21788_t